MNCALFIFTSFKKEIMYFVLFFSTFFLPQLSCTIIFLTYFYNREFCWFQSKSPSTDNKFAGRPFILANSASELEKFWLLFKIKVWLLLEKFIFTINVNRTCLPWYRQCLMFSYYGFIFISQKEMMVAGH